MKNTLLLLLLLLLLLFLLSLVAAEASTEVSVCPGGRVEFICQYPSPTRSKPTSVSVVDPTKTTLTSTVENKWEHRGRVSLYHDTRNRRLRVTIRQLQSGDFGEYKCKFRSTRSNTETVEVELMDRGCRDTFIQTAYREAETTITCDFSGVTRFSNVNFFCKESGSTCEDIISNGTFTLTKTSEGFSVSISDVSSQHEGAYWCGLESHTGRYRAALRKIQLKVDDVRSFTRSPTTGQNFTFWCKVPDDAPINKFICKGADPSVCVPLVNTQQLSHSGKFSMKEDRLKTNVTITIRDLTADDSGTYWCGAKSTNPTQSHPLYLRLLMTVVPSPSSSSTPPVSTTQSSAAPAESKGGLSVVVTVIVCVAVLLLLLFALILILICKRASNTKNKRSGAAAHCVKEGHVYEEIEKDAQSSGNTTHTIYASVNLPGNPSAPVTYSTINFPSGAGGRTRTPGPSYTVCEYSTVKSQSSASSTVNRPSTSTDDPFYSTVNKPQ